jgi:hypothetical protein
LWKNEQPQEEELAVVEIRTDDSILKHHDEVNSNSTDKESFLRG